jgi:nucleoid DNA-binding protein
MAKKKTAKKVASKTASKVAKKTAKKAVKRPAAGEKFVLHDDILEGVLEIAEITRKGELRIKRTDLKRVLDESFERAAIVAAGGEKVKLPFLGNLMYSEVKARKAGSGVNPFTGEPMQIKARPASRKPRFSFARTVKETFANKKNW